MTAALLREAGRALYGERWQTDLARDLKVSDRTVRRWDAETHAMPAGLWADLRTLLKVRGLALAVVRRKLPR